MPLLTTAHTLLTIHLTRHLHLLHVVIQPTQGLNTGVHTVPPIGHFHGGNIAESTQPF